MTISATYSPDTYAGDGSTTTFAITFSFLSVSTNVKVSVKVDSTGVITEKTAATHYNVSGSNVVFTAGNIPASGETVIIELNPDFTQTSDYTENSNFPAETLEADLDERTLEGQINNDLVSRGFRVDSSTSLSGKTLAVELPSSGTEVLTVTSTGLGSSAATALGALTLPVSVANGGTGSTTASAARTALGLAIGTDVQAYDADLTTLSTAFTTASASGAASLAFAEDTDNGSNAVTLQGPASTADVTLTLPAATDTLVGKATTDTLTNKTIDCDGTGNVITNVGSSEIKSEMITGTTGGTVAAGDSFIFSDVDDSGNLKSDTIQGILDLAGGASAATQAEMETGTATNVYVSPGRQHFHDSACKVWLHLNGTGTPSVAEGYNVASITDLGTGIYTVVIDTDMSTTSYPAVSGGPNQIYVQTDSQAVGSFRLISRLADGTQTLIDTAALFAAVFGDH